MMKVEQVKQIVIRKLHKNAQNQFQFTIEKDHVKIRTPYKDMHGSIVELMLEEKDDYYVLTDYGYLLADFSILGNFIFNHADRKIFFFDSLERNQVDYSDQYDELYVNVADLNELYDKIECLHRVYEELITLYKIEQAKKLDEQPFEVPEYWKGK